MQKYSESAVCPKCGGNEATSCYYPKWHWENIIKDETSSREYIKRQCVRCGYTWAEEPLDIGEESDK